MNPHPPGCILRGCLSIVSDASGVSDRTASTTCQLLTPWFQRSQKLFTATSKPTLNANAPAKMEVTKMPECPVIELYEP